MIKKLIEKVKRIDDEAMLNPEQVLKMGVIVNTKLEPSNFSFYRMMKRGEIAYINLGTQKAPRYFVKGKDLKAFLLKRYETK